MQGRMHGHFSIMSPLSSPQFSLRSAAIWFRLA